MSCTLFRRARGGLLRLAAAVVAVALLAGCGRMVNGAAERKIRNALAEYIGPARAWAVHIDNPPDRTLRGHLARVLIDGQGVEMPHGLTVAALHLDVRDVDVDTRREEVRAIGAATFRAVVDGAALNDWLRANPAPPSEPVHLQSVELQDGHIIIHATRTLLGRDVPFTVTAEPRLASPTRVEFEPDRMTVLGLPVPLPASVLRWIAQRLDSGFDLAALPFTAQATDLQVTEGQVSVSGTADVLATLQRRRGA